MTTPTSALGLLPSGTFLLTSAFEGKRAGVIVPSVQACPGEPPVVCVAMRKGHWIEPLIRDSRFFAIHVIDPRDRLITRKFGDPTRAREPGDPFDCLPVDRLVTGAPIVKRCLGVLDCEVVRHIDVETEHGLYIALVRGSKVFPPQAYQQTVEGGASSPTTAA